MQKGIEVDPNRASGVPVIEGTHITVAQFLAELNEGNSIQSIADNYEIPINKLNNVLLFIHDIFNTSFV